MGNFSTEELSRLSQADRLQLIEQIWCSLDAPDALPVTPAQQAELARRLADPSPVFVSPQALKARLAQTRNTTQRPAHN
jgi:putative addiction module component (TIGR02574 family)